ncbi:MAG: DUF3473 domain-containing protein, partial [Waddliaceae bacterium]
WEIDPDQPRINGGLLSRFRHYVNLRKTEDVVNRLIRDFKFVPFRSLDMPISAGNGNFFEEKEKEKLSK